MRRLFALLWILPALGLGLLTAPSTHAAALDHAHGILGATDTLVLVIDGVDEQLAAHGLSRTRIEQAMTTSLRAAGLQVVTENELASAEHAGVLRLRVRLNRAPYQFYLYNVNLTLNSKLPISGKTFVTTATWSDGWVGAMQPTDVGQIQVFTEELLARFLSQRTAERGS